MIKILHLADLHLGLEFSRYPSIAALLKEERIRALRNYIERANQEKADIIVVAGDLFDKLTVSQKLVKETKSILALFHGETIVIPGNHDWYNRSANDNKIWEWFLEAPANNVHLLNEWRPYPFQLSEHKIIFYPCGCHQKHSNDHLIGWVKDEIKSNEAIHIGIAHGNVEGYGLDEEGNYFNMRTDELKAAGVDCWLLGHIHAPYPKTEIAVDEVFFFAGNHCSDSWKAERAGGAWLIEIDAQKKLKATRWHHQGICFRDRMYTINNVHEANSMLSEIKNMIAEQTVLRIYLNGSLTEDELNILTADFKSHTEGFLYIEPYWNMTLKITSDEIDKLYVNGSIPHTLLKELSKKEEDILAMQLAYETIKSITP
jgi:exonuclease SbcD